MNSPLPPVMILEDSDEDFEVTVSALRLRNLPNPVLRCANATAVGRFLRREGPFASIPRPALILLDLNLAGADGRKLIPKIRQNDWLRPVPINVLTTSSSPADVELCYAHGANAYLVKPVNLERFEMMVENLVTFWFDTAGLPAAINEVLHV